MENLIQILGLKKTYSTGDDSVEVNALDGVDLCIKRGEFVAIMGPSGSGKSTLMQILGLLDKKSSGTYLLDGEDISNLSEDHLAQIRSKKIGFIFQFFNLLPRTSCLDNVGLPMLYSGENNPGPRATSLLNSVGLGERLQHKSHQLSGGQQQRVAIARALANNPKIIFADEPTGNISTQQTEEILDMLDELNRNGTTIVLVTHEPEVAARARRLITIRDGKIFNDVTQKEPLVRANFTEANVNEENYSSDNKNFWTRVKENFKMAKVSLSLNKLRTGLATLGVVIGIASFVAMMAIGEGAKEAIKAQISSFGTNIINIRAMSGQSSKSIQGEGYRKFDMNDFDVIKNWSLGKSIIKGIDAQVYGNVTLAYSSKNSLSEVIGATTAFERMQNYKPAIGRFFTEEEYQSKVKVAVIGQTVAKNLFGRINPVGSIIKINKMDFTVIGLLNEKGSTSFKDRDDVVVIPLTTAMNRVLGRKTLHVITIEARDQAFLDMMESETVKFLKEYRNIAPNETNDFEVRNMNDIKALYTQTTDIITSMLQAIASVALLVGGIGIMNVMFVSVKERTREVGLRKAIGAKKNDILLQFLIESILIGVIGGFFGVILGFVISKMAGSYLQWEALVSFSAIFIAFTFSVMVGVVFGLWPAKQASELSSIEALRFE